MESEQEFKSEASQQSCVYFQLHLVSKVQVRIRGELDLTRAAFLEGVGQRERGKERRACAQK